MAMQDRRWTIRWAGALIPAVVALAGCSEDPEAKTDAGSSLQDAVDASGDSTATADTGADTGADTQAVDSYSWTPKKYKATIRWTSYGIPHIQGASLGDAAFGQGYAFAKENLCTLADQIVKVRSERAKYFGPGADGIHITNDFGYRALRVMDYAHQAWQGQGLSPEVRDILEGYAAGFNQRMQEAGPSGWPSACKDAKWVKPVTPVELLAYYHDLALLASGRNLRKYLAFTAVPEKSVTQALPLLAPDGFERWCELDRQLADATSEFKQIREHTLGSNGWGVGKDKSESGQGLVVGNPHFPWFGELRLWESHITVPGVVDVQGATLSGVPMVLIGHNAHLAFTATVSQSTKFTVYKMALDPADPTAYVIDGKSQKMTSHQATIEILQPDGSLKSETRTFWRTHFGPIAVIGGIAEWTTETAWALRDANEGHSTILEHFLRVNQAKSVADLQKVCETVQGNPWTNTMAADDTGAAFYSESHSTPNLSAAAVEEWQKKALQGGDVISKLAWDNGMILLDGSKGSNQWAEEPGARKLGLRPFAKTPHLIRQDYVLNANDSHWLSNLSAPLEGYLFPYGPEKTVRSARTRLNLRMMTEANGASGADGKFTAEELRAMVHNGRSNVAETYHQELVARCKPGSTVDVAIDGGKAAPVDLSEACSVLAAWDGTYLPDSKGAVLWREFFTAPGGPSPFAALPFDAKEPLMTPKGLIAAPEKGQDPYLELLGKAVLALQKGKRKLDATIGELQYTMKGDQRISIPGGYHSEGAFQVISASLSSNDTLLPKMTVAPFVTKEASLLTEQGYPVGYGSSFVMVVELGKDRPKGQAIISYSQSADPQSPNFADQTQLFSQRKFRPMLWTDAEIAADPGFKTQDVAN
jgi:acyl-homoserine-lactone acylase